MNAIDLIRRLHEHRIWANHNLVAAAGGVSDESLRKTFAIGQGSIWKTLLHLYAAEHVWLESMLGREQAITPGDVPGNQEAAGAIDTLDELQTRWSDLDQRWQTHLRDLTPANLDETVYRVSSNGMRFGTAPPTRCCTCARTPTTRPRRPSTCFARLAPRSCPRSC